MYREQILGTWQSIAVTIGDKPFRRYEREQYTFYSDGTGRMHSKALLIPDASFTWNFNDGHFYIFNLGGASNVFIASIEDGQLIVMGSTRSKIYTTVYTRI